MPEKLYNNGHRIRLIVTLRGMKDTQHKDTWHNDTQHNDIRQNGIQCSV